MFTAPVCAGHVHNHLSADSLWTAGSVMGPRLCLISLAALDAGCWMRKWTLVESRARAMVMVGDGSSGRAAHWAGYVKRFMELLWIECFG